MPDDFIEFYPTPPPGRTHVLDDPRQAKPLMKLISRMMKSKTTRRTVRQKKKVKVM